MTFDLRLRYRNALYLLYLTLPYYRLTLRNLVGPVRILTLNVGLKHLSVVSNPKSTIPCKCLNHIPNKAAILFIS